MVAMGIIQNDDLKNIALSVEQKLKKVIDKV